MQRYNTSLLKDRIESTLIRQLLKQLETIPRINNVSSTTPYSE